MVDAKLKKALEKFQSELKDARAKGELSAIRLADLFRPIAQRLLYGGCFTVFSKGVLEREVYPATVEFYYHEEADGGFKDYIVYHRRKIMAIDGKQIEDVPYFELGAINAHQSGIDITFESVDGQYRASALIRAFRYQKGCEEIVDERSTYLYDQLFTGLEMPITVQWKSSDSLPNTNPKQGFRVNSFLLKPNPGGEGKPIKETDRRPWAFSVKAFRPSLRYDPKKAE